MGVAAGVRRRWVDGAAKSPVCFGRRLGIATRASGFVSCGPLRLVAQDIGFSVREQGFDSPRGYWFRERGSRGAGELVIS